MLQILEGSHETISRNFVGIATKEVKGNQIQTLFFEQVKASQVGWASEESNSDTAMLDCLFADSCEFGFFIKQSI